MNRLMELVLVAAWATSVPSGHVVVDLQPPFHKEPEVNEPSNLMVWRVAPELDLPQMLARHVQRRCREALAQAEDRRAEATRAGTWKSLREEIRRDLRAGLGELPFGKMGGPLNAQVVSRHERPHYRLENVLFDSLPGWQVNASVYLPVDTPPPWPAVVVPVGHSGKQFEAYQIPAQVFARCGYVAVTFDPPGQAGEKQPGNDHFIDGIRCYLTGHCANRYFVLDALRCIDYLETRDDVDLSRGVAMTGVSGGGMTTMAAALLDDRIACAAPSCCVVPALRHPVGDLYTGCPEGVAFGQWTDGLDHAGQLGAAMPTPLLVMAGRGDEVFHLDWTERVCEEVRAAYESAGYGERFDFFVDESGHDYTVPMALRCVAWMNRWLRNEPDRPVPELTRADFELEPWEVLRCYPAPEENMFTINRALARRWAQERDAARSLETLRAAARRVASLPDGGLATPPAVAGEPMQVWVHGYQEVRLKPEPDVELPASFLYPLNTAQRSPAVLYLDERGRWTRLKQQGLLAQAARFIDRDAAPGPAIFSVDLRGWGETQPQPVPFDLAGWCDANRILSYLAVGLRDSLFAMRVRDALAALAYLRQRPEADPERIVVGGHGLGAAVALHAAVIDGRVVGAFGDGMLARFQELTEAQPYAWGPDAFVPNVLCDYDLPDLAGGLAPTPVLLVNPLDGQKQPLSSETATEYYADALARNPNLTLHAGLDSGEADQRQLEWLGQVVQTSARGR